MSQVVFVCVLRSNASPLKSVSNLSESFFWTKIKDKLKAEDVRADKCVCYLHAVAQTVQLLVVDWLAAV